MKKRSISYLCDTKVKIDSITALDAEAIWYAPSFMSQISLPVRNTGENEYKRVNGNRALSILSPTSVGLPYGSMPRILLMWLSTQAILNKSNEIYLGSSAAQFLKGISKQPSGGINGSRRALKNAYLKLFSSHITIHEQSENKWDIENISIVKTASAIWQPHQSTWQTTLVLNCDFYNDLTSKAFPVDQRVIQACSHYPLAIDVYLWATKRAFSARRPFLVRWDQLEAQFGNQFSQLSNFKIAFKKAVKRVQIFYPGFMCGFSKDGALVSLKSTHVSTLENKALVKEQPVEKPEENERYERIKGVSALLQAMSNRNKS